MVDANDTCFSDSVVGSVNAFQPFGFSSFISWESEDSHVMVFFVVRFTSGHTARGGHLEKSSIFNLK